MESSILTSLLSNDNQTRTQAESQLEQEFATNPSNLMNLFLGGMQNENLEVASIACVLFKKYFLDDDKRAGQAVSAEDLEQMKTAIMTNLSWSQPIKLLKRKGDIISKIFHKQEKSEELLGMLVEWAQAESNVGRQFSMYVFEVVADCHLSSEQVIKFKDSFMTIFSKTLTDRDIHVKVASLKATAAFLTSVDDSEVALQYIEIIPHLLNTVVEALQTDEEQGKLALQSMVELTNIHPEIFKNKTAQLVNVFSQVMLQKNFEDSTRASATEVILSLANSMPASLRKIPETKSMLIPAVVQMLTEVEEDEATWMETVESKDMGSVDPFNTGVNAINRLSVDLGEKTILQPCTQIIKTCIASQDWRQRQAGYMLFGLIGEACKDSLNKNLDEAMKMACSGLLDAHPRVRYAGLSCTALIITETSPKAQYKYHQELVPMLMKMMKEEPMVKIQAYAVSATINFMRGLIDSDEEEESQENRKNQKIVNLYTAQLLDILSTLLKAAMQKNYEPLQEEVLNLLSCVATAIEKDFAPYYPVFMPMMLEVLTVIPMATIQQKTLRGQAVQTMGFFIESISEEKEQFKANVLEITTSLITLMNSNLTSDDPQILAIKETLTKIAFFLKEDFNQFMPTMLTSLIKDASQDIDIKMESADLARDNSNAGFTFKLKGMEGEQKISMNTSALESKIAAFKLINMISESTGAQFAPYCETILPIMIEHVQYAYSRTIRKYSFKTVKNILISVGEPTNVTLFKNMFPIYCQLIEKANKGNDLKELKLILKHFFLNCKALNENNKAHKDYMDEAQFNTLGPLLQTTLSLVKEAKTQSLNTTNLKKLGIEMDEEDMETLKEELAKICSASTFVMEISGQLVLNFGERARQMVKSNLTTYFALNLNNYKNISESELLDATCFFCDFVEYAHHDDEKMIQELNQKFMEIFKWTRDIDPKQTLSYGMGVFAMWIQPLNYVHVLPTVYHNLVTMICEEDAFEDDKIVASETAVGALGKLIYFHKDGATINDEGVVLFLGKLPLTSEEEEAQKSHLLFLQQAKTQNPKLVSQTTMQYIKGAIARIAKEAESNDEVKILCETGQELIKQLL